MAVEPIFSNETVCLIGTGPSLTMDQVDVARKKGFPLLGVNLIYRFVPDLAVLFATNECFWDYYPDAVSHPAQKWTNNKEAARKYRLNYVDAREAPGLSRNPKFIHHGHSSGYCLLNLAYLLGAKRIILLGYDMRFASDYDGKNKSVGSSPRHFFGEYVPQCQHWPSFSIKDGVHVEMVALYESVAKQGVIEIVNCTPGSAIECFPRRDIESL